MKLFFVHTEIDIHILNNNGLKLHIKANGFEWLDICLVFTVHSIETVNTQGMYIFKITLLYTCIAECWTWNFYFIYLLIEFM